MTDRQWSSLNEQEFDCLLEQSLPPLPPNDVAAEVDPGREALTRVLLGIALTHVTVQFLSLHYILPLAGAILMLLGFRTLRRENRWFSACWWVSVSRTALTLFQYALYSTPLRVELAGTRFETLFAASVFLLEGSRYLFFWLALRSVRRKAGLTPGAWSAAALVPWYAGAAVMARYSAGDRRAAFTMAVLYVIILYVLLRIPRDLDGAGYVLSPTPIRRSDRAVTLSLLAVLAAGLLCGFLFLERYPMDWDPVSAEENASVTEVKAHLRALGLPEDILNDLTGEELLACAGAVRVLTETEEQTLRKHRGAALRAVSAAIELPDGRWTVIYHFRWANAPGFHGTQCLSLSSMSDTPNASVGVEEVTGRLLCEVDGQTRTADYHSSEVGSVDIPFDGHTLPGTQGWFTFSFPEEGTDLRGYLLYTVEEVPSDHLLGTTFRHSVQTGRFQYPAVDARSAVPGAFSSLPDLPAFDVLGFSVYFYPNGY